MSTYFVAKSIPTTNTLNVTSNGLYSVIGYTNANVSVPPSVSLQSLTISENGTYSASSGYAFNSVTVNVPVYTFADFVESKIAKNIDVAYGPSASFIANYAFWNCWSLTTASFPQCMTIGDSAFFKCALLTTASFPQCTTIGTNAFYSCSSLTQASFPQCTTIGNYAFWNCWSLTTISFPQCTTIGEYAFGYCSRLISLYLSSITSVPTLDYSAFYRTPIGGYSTYAQAFGSVYVPASLYNEFSLATNWSDIFSRIVALT